MVRTVKVASGRGAHVNSGKPPGTLLFPKLQNFIFHGLILEITVE